MLHVLCSTENIVTEFYPIYAEHMFWFFFCNLHENHFQATHTQSMQQKSTQQKKYFVQNRVRANVIINR